MLIFPEYEKIKFYIGPISKNTVDVVSDFSIKENIQIGILPTRRQIDYDGGYVNNWTTDTFFDYIHSDPINRSYTVLERDHGGINQGRYYDNGTLSFYKDSHHFQIIHIDPWLNYNYDFKKSINETIDNIKFIHELDKRCLFEIGTEESIYPFDVQMLENMLKILKNKLGELFNSNILYCVIQSGTKLKGTKNIGKFDLEKLKRMVGICEKYDILSKEHNGDYLTQEEIKIRFDNGLSAINIAPEFGVIETDTLLENMNEDQKEIFFKICLDSNKWQKWVDCNFEPLENKIELMRICGHYQLSTPEFKNMNINFDDIIKEKLYNKLKTMHEL